jgi:hypothetical protein
MNFIVTSTSNNIFVSVPKALEGTLCNIKSMSVVLESSKKHILSFNDSEGAKYTYPLDKTNYMGDWASIALKCGENLFALSRPGVLSRYLKLTPQNIVEGTYKPTLSIDGSPPDDIPLEGGIVYILLNIRNGE